MDIKSIIDLSVNVETDAVSEIIRGYISIVVLDIGITRESRRS